MPETLNLDENVRVTLDSTLARYEEREKEGARLSELSKKFQRDGRIAERDDFLEIVEWKASRSIGHARKNHASAIRDKTKQAFEMASREQVAEALDVLGMLHGVKTRMATSLLMFYDPYRFTVMDEYVWRSLVHLGVLDPFDCWFEESVDYPVYLQACLSVAEWYGRSLRDTDRALWQLASAKLEEHKSPRGRV